MSIQETVTAGAVLVGSVLPLVALWLRLHFRARGERERCRYLAAAAALPAGSVVQEHRDDGTRLTLRVGTPRKDTTHP